MSGAMLTLVDLARRTGTPMPKRWIKKAVSGAHGQFAAKAKAAGETTREYAEEKKDAPGTLGKEARLASTLMGMHHSRAAKRYAGSKKG
jgi:hypothetical protein